MWKWEFEAKNATGEELSILMRMASRYLQTLFASVLILTSVNGILNIIARKTHVLIAKRSYF